MDTKKDQESHNNNDNNLFKSEIVLSFDDADPAGIIFFPNALKLAHRTYEAFIQYLGITWVDWFQNKDFFVVVRSAKAEYLSPLFPGRKYQVKVKIKKVGETSLILGCTFYEKNMVESMQGEVEKICIEVETVHVFVSQHTMQKISIPLEIKKHFLK